MERGSGVLLHISSLPSKYGIGSFGSEAKKFVKLLKLGGQKYWQVLPLNPTGFKDSPYQSSASFALNPYFIDLSELCKKGYLNKDDLKEHTKNRNNQQVDFGYLFEHRYLLLKKASEKVLHFESKKVEKFYHSNKYWLEDYALFMCLKEQFHYCSWDNWPDVYKKHNKDILKEYEENNLDLFMQYVAIQYLAYSQYMRLKKHANRNGVKIIGDLPIYVSYDSCDVWGHQKDFLLNKLGKPTLVAGVPPDYFSKTGQLWRNPLYNYKKMQANHFKWWAKRMQFASKLYDVIRIDHFRGFASYYAIDAKEETAVNGTWLTGPREAIIDVFKQKCKAEIIAEDLGILSEDVYDLLEYSNYPGMKIFQFAFDGNADNDYLPHRYIENCVAYLGTHDNETYVSFLNEHQDKEKMIRDYLHINITEDVISASIEALLNSKANLVIFSLQDLLRKDNTARINTPGEENNNWTFRFTKKDFNKQIMLDLYRKVCDSKRY